MPEPDPTARERILEIHTREMSLDDVDLGELAADTDGFTGAELSSLTTEAGMFAIRDDRTAVRMKDFQSALAKVRDEDGSAGVPIAFA